MPPAATAYAPPLSPCSPVARSPVSRRLSARSLGGRAMGGLGDGAWHAPRAYLMRRASARAGGRVYGCEQTAVPFFKKLHL